MDPLVGSFVVVHDNPVHSAVVPFTPQHTVSHLAAFNHYLTYFLPIARQNLKGTWDFVKSGLREVWNLFR